MELVYLRIRMLEFLMVFMDRKLYNRPMDPKNGWEKDFLLHQNPPTKKHVSLSWIIRVFIRFHLSLGINRHILR